MQKITDISTSSPVSIDADELDIVCVPQDVFIEYRHILETWKDGMPKRKIAVFDDDIFSDPIGWADPQLIRYPLAVDPKETFVRFAWEHVFLRTALWLPRDYILPWAYDFNAAVQGVHLVASEMQDYGVRVYRNVKQNLLHQVYSFDALKDCLSQTPAIICGAGSTLSDNIDLISGLYQHSLICAAGAAASALSRAPAPFHVAAGLDPNPDYYRFLQSNLFEIPFFYQNRFSSDILDKIQGEKIALPSNAGYVFEEWIAEHLGSDASSFDAGWTAATLLVALTTHMGCNPIILVGVDLEADECRYARELSQERDVISSANTKQDWMMSRLWLKDWVEKHPHITFVSTSKHLAIPLARNMSLQEVVDSSKVDEGDVKGLLHAAIEKAKRKSHYDRVKKAFDELEESFAIADEILKKMVDLFAFYHPHDPTAKGEFILLEYDLKELTCYAAVLMPVWQVWQHVFMRHSATAHEVLHRILFFQTILSEYRSQECGL